MKLPPLAIALFASVLITGCATKKQQQSTPAQTALEKKDMRKDSRWAKTDPLNGVAHPSVAPAEVEYSPAWYKEHGLGY
jgi:hypothetical protein